MTSKNGAEWAERLTRARQRMFPTSWQAAKALARLDPANLPDAKTLHRYWSERWETGAIRPNRTYRELIERLLDAPGLFHDGESRPLPPPNPAALPALPTAPAVPAAPAVPPIPAVPAQPVHPVQDGASQRPVCPPTVAGAEFEYRPVWGREVRMAADEAADNAARFDAQIGHATLEHLRDEVVRIARAYTALPLPEVFRAARRARELAAELVERTRRPAQLADLHTVAGQACGLLATAAFDMGYWDAAARLADAGIIHGDIAGHDGLRAWLLGRKADLAIWQGHPDDALNRIDTALAFAPPGTATMRLRAIEARARAVLSDRDGTTRAIHAGEQAREVDRRDDLHDVIGGEFGFVPARQEFNAGSAYIALRDGMSAEAHSQRALDLYAALPPEQRAYYAENGARVDLAVARLLRGDLHGAREALAPVFALPPAQRVSGVTGRLAQARALLGADVFRNSRIARQLAADIADFTSDTTGRALPPGDL